MRYLYLVILLAGLNIQSEAQSIYDFQLDTPDGESLSYSDIKGSSVTIIDFWATWCKPCVNSIPKLVKLSQEYSSDEVAFIGVTIDSPRNLSKITPFTQSVGITYPILLDTDQELMRELNVTVIPTLIIVNSDDEVIAIHEGFAPGDEVKLKTEIDELLHEKK